MWECFYCQQKFQHLYSYIMTKFNSFKIFLAVNVITIIYIWDMAESTQYFPHLIAPYTQINALILGILSSMITFKCSFSKLQNKINKTWAILISLLSILCSYHLYKLKIYPFSVVWIFSALIIRKKIRKAQSKDITIQQIELQQSASVKRQILPSDIISQDKKQVLQIIKKNSKSFRIVNNIAFFVIILLFILYNLNTFNIVSYTQQFPIIGKTITFKPSGKHQKVTFHYYCSNISSSQHPTVFLEHGGGGNLVGFLPLIRSLETKGIKMCAYDRLGYGRSSKLIPNLTLKQRSQITDSFLDTILRTDEKVIYGGWSAGVQLSIAYSYYHPERVAGLIFMDGYPDYRYLEAIQSNSTTIPNHHELLISNIFRFLQPYGIDSFFGKNQIEDQQLNHYYQAYYKTGYLWDTQTNDLKYLKGTQELSQAATRQKSIIPYPQSKIYINWPDITVPLLIMPANDTINGDGGRQYKTQVQKYLLKCLNPIKRIEVIEGDHGFVMISQKKVADVIQKFINDI